MEQGDRYNVGSEDCSVRAGRVMSQSVSSVGGAVCVRAVYCGSCRVPTERTTGRDFRFPSRPPSSPDGTRHDTARKKIKKAITAAAAPTTRSQVLSGRPVVLEQYHGGQALPASSTAQPEVFCDSNRQARPDSRPLTKRRGRAPIAHIHSNQAARTSAFPRRRRLRSKADHAGR